MKDNNTQNNLWERFNDALISKIVDHTIHIVALLIIASASFAKDSWFKIPEMERFVFVPWLLFGYGYFLCHKYEKANNISKLNRKKFRSNYVLNLFWGLFFLVFHYAEIIFAKYPIFKKIPLLPNLHNSITTANSSIGLLFGNETFYWIQVVGLSIALAGAILAGVGRVYIDGYWGKDVYDYDEDNKVVTTGPYSKIRHPIYTGQILLVFGSAIVSGDLTMYVFLFLVLLLTQKRANNEELSLIHLYNDKKQTINEKISELYFIGEKLKVIGENMVLEGSHLLEQCKTSSMQEANSMSFKGKSLITRGKDLVGKGLEQITKAEDISKRFENHENIYNEYEYYQQKVLAQWIIPGVF